MYVSLISQQIKRNRTNKKTKKSTDCEKTSAYHWVLAVYQSLVWNVNKAQQICVLPLCRALCTSIYINGHWIYERVCIKQLCAHPIECLHSWNSAKIENCKYSFRLWGFFVKFFVFVCFGIHFFSQLKFRKGLSSQALSAQRAYILHLRSHGMKEGYPIKTINITINNVQRTRV